MVSRSHFLITFLALHKPWLYLVALCYLFTMAFVALGNPALSIQALERHGLTWHHIPEILAFSFLGVWLGSLGYLSSESLTHLDSLALFLTAVVGLAYAEVISYIKMFPVVLTIIFIPSFSGYFAIRLYTIHKSKHSFKRANQQST